MDEFKREYSNKDTGDTTFSAPESRCLLPQHRSWKENIFADFILFWKWNISSLVTKDSQLFAKTKINFLRKGYVKNIFIPALPHAEAQKSNHEFSKIAISKLDYMSYQIFPAFGPVGGPPKMEFPHPNLRFLYFFIFIRPKSYLT